VTVRRLVGYCPQFDALIDNLTGREHLCLFARIKGIPKTQLYEYVQKIIEKLGIREYADRPAGTYSGGNKRKLSVGIALIGNPKIVFLDEPTSGVDPASRRFMWSLIATTMQGRSVILTTHSMEECEALCDKIAIMVNGRLRCIGPASHLKAKYGQGYQCEITLHDEDTRPALFDFMASNFPGTVVVESHGRHDSFKIPRGIMSLANIFRTIEQNKETLKVDDYAISETALEQIFIGFASQQVGEKEQVPSAAPPPMQQQQPYPPHQPNATTVHVEKQEYVVDNGPAPGAVDDAIEEDGLDNMAIPVEEQAMPTTS